MKKNHKGEKIYINDEVINSIIAKYAITDFDYQLTQEGSTNTSIIVNTPSKKFVLRIYAFEKKSDNEIGFELDFLDFLGSHGIPVPV
jgi:Ser/Thr protein kinase RdoA (MazF antagonist)